LSKNWNKGKNTETQRRSGGKQNRGVRGKGVQRGKILASVKVTPKTDFLERKKKNGLGTIAKKKKRGGGRKRTQEGGKKKRKKKQTKRGATGKKRGVNQNTGVKKKEKTRKGGVTGKRGFVNTATLKSEQKKKNGEKKRWTWGLLAGWGGGEEKPEKQKNIKHHFNNQWGREITIVENKKKPGEELGGGEL